jgi:hypothetical protein
MTWTWLDEIPWIMALALATPAGGLFAWRLAGAARGRLLIALAALGPFAAALWVLELALMRALGFASPWAALVLIAIAASAGAGIGWWVRTGPAPSTGSPDEDRVR